MPTINVSNISVFFPEISVSGRSLKKTILGLNSKKRDDTDSGMKLRREVLKNISFDLQPGDRLGLIGPNGAGKTTLLRVLAGIFEPSIGSVNIKGDVAAILSFDTGVNFESTGRENIVMCSLMNGATTDEIKQNIEDIAQFTGLGHYIDAPMHTYSSGMKIRLLFAVATSINTDILLLDEWLGVADQSFQKKAESRMMELVERAKIIVLASHDQALIERSCNKILVLENGRTVKFGDNEKLLSAPLQSHHTSSHAPIDQPEVASVRTLDRDAVVWAYRLILGREPENLEVVLEMEKLGSIEQLRKVMLDSKEYRDMLASPDHVS